jgi:hypothetical protein
MKYYIADDEDPEFAASEQRYVEYIRSVWDMLPPDLRLLCDRRASLSPERIYLNDSNVQSVHADFGSKAVNIVLLGESLTEDHTQIGTRLFTLSYGLVQDLACDGAYDYDFPFGALRSDHIWDEIEVLESGLFEHRMLFAGGGWMEMSIVFGKLSVTYADTLHT